MLLAIGFVVGGAVLGSAATLGALAFIIRKDMPRPTKQ